MCQRYGRLRLVLAGSPARHSISRNRFESEIHERLQAGLAREMPKCKMAVMRAAEEKIATERQQMQLRQKEDKAK